MSLTDQNEKLYERPLTLHWLAFVSSPVTPFVLHPLLRKSLIGFRKFTAHRRTVTLIHLLFQRRPAYITSLRSVSINQAENLYRTGADQVRSARSSQPTLYTSPNSGRLHLHDQHNQFITFQPPVPTKSALLQLNCNVFLTLTLKSPHYLIYVIYVRYRLLVSKTLNFQIFPLSKICLVSA